jgi:SRSO17 transposase
MEVLMTSSGSRFRSYVESLGSVMGHADRTGPLAAYCSGLLLPLERKSAEPMAAALDPEHTPARHQSLLHFVGQSPWSDADVLAKVRDLVLPAMTRHEPVSAWIIDDTAFPKKGKHSVGVSHQYCGELGKQANCQVAVTLSVANARASLPVAYRLYLPQPWASDAERRKKAGVPEDVVFKTKPQIALGQIKAAHAAGVPAGVVLADAAYGNDYTLRTALTALGLAYAVGIVSTTTVWAPGTEPLKPKPWIGSGRRATRLQRDDTHKPVSAKALAESLPARRFRTVTWREGSNLALTSRFAAVRVRPAWRDTRRQEPHAEEWLLIEWPKGDAEPFRYWLSTLPETTPLKTLVNTAKLRWRIERDYLDLKQDIGLGHYEGRSWRGFHHHATLAIAAYGFLIAERESLPPSAREIPRKSRVSKRQTKRSTARTHTASRSKLHHQPAPETHSIPRKPTRPMSLLLSIQTKNTEHSKAFMTQ